MSQIINTSNVLYGDVILEPLPEEPFVKTSGYFGVPTRIKEAIQRGETFYLGVELYTPNTDEIWQFPDRAVFTFSDSRFRWRNRLYKDKIQSIPELAKFIGKQFNSFTFEMMNVERGPDSGSRFAFKNLIRGMRVGVRIIFPELDDVNYSRLLWWGRISHTEDITEQSLKINCSQEIGDFSYELATQEYGTACPLWFGKGDCLGNQTFTEKSLLYQTAFNEFGQGGCNRTFARCQALGNDRFYQGQKAVTVTGQFIRTTVEKKGWWIFSWKKTTRTPVPYSSKNQSDNDKVTIGIVLGRARVELRAFTWADIGTQITALMGACRGRCEGFFNITSHNPRLTLLNATQHLGEYGGEGTQQPDPRFPDSGFNSRLTYAGVTLDGSPAEDEPEEVPTITAVIKGLWVGIRDRFSGDFFEGWSNNPVWITRFLMMNFPFTVVKKEWFNEVKNQDTADYCFTVVEDDTGAEIPTITGSSYNDYQAGEFPRYHSTGIFNSASLYRQELQGGQNVYRSEMALSVPIPIDDGGGVPPDIIWSNGIGGAGAAVNRTYLQHRYTANGVINQKAKLSDILFSLVLPTFRGYFRFNHFGQIEIDCRKPADNSFVREGLDAASDTNPGGGVPVASTEIPVASVVKFHRHDGWLLIGVGLKTSEIAKIIGIRYVNGSALTVVTAATTGQLGLTVSPAFIPRTNAPAEVYMDFTGQPTAGECIHLTFTEPNGGILKWDYYVDSSDDTLDTIVQMFKTRLMASPSFRESWTAEVFSGIPYRIFIRCQTGYVQLDRQTVHPHFIGEEVLRVVEVYEDGKDDVYSETGVRDNMKDFTLNNRRQDTYHGVKGTYISAVQDFRETEIQPRIAWDAAEQERNLNLLELDLRFVDNYRQAAFLIKSATIQFVDGNLPASFKSGILALFHEEGEVIAVRHQTMEGISYTPFSIENIKYEHSSQATSLECSLYLSAAYDERVAKEEKFLESTLTPNTEPQATPAPTVSDGGYSSTGTGDGGGDRRQNIKYETQPYETFPDLQQFSPHGRDRM